MHPTQETNRPEDEHIAYFSMEIGINHKIPTYSGGLGVLAGDTLKAFADIGMPVIGVTLLNQKGYFYQKIDGDGNQHEDEVHWSVNDFMTKLPNEVSVNIEGREVKLRAWEHLLQGVNGDVIPILFLDSDVEGNSDYDKTLTSYLYGGDRQYRLCQEIILGIGGTRMIESLGYNNISKYHMNEGHAALLTVELLRKTFRDSGGGENNYDVNSVKEKCVFTTHTPVAAGHDRFEINLFKRLLGDFVPEFLVQKAIDDNHINMTLFGLTLSKFVNGVAKRHEQVTKEMFPGYNIESITNGVHAETWTCDHLQKLFDEFIPGWKKDPTTLRSASFLPRDKVWEQHRLAKKDLLDEVNSRTNLGFDVDIFTIGFARRFTAYKRPDLLLHDVERLKQMANNSGPIQIIFAGKAHKSDGNGKKIIKKVFHLANDINSQNGHIKIAFVENYDMKVGKLLISGCDLWLNTPQRPFEASGTSGMKAALNAVPQLSTLDGWWLEGHFEGVTGWCIGAHPHDPDFDNNSDIERDVNSLYTKLEEIIIPMFYQDHDAWTRVMRNAIALNGSFFNTYRMARQYMIHAYDLKL